MPGFKVVIGTKDGKCVQKEISETDAPAWFGKKIGDTVTGDALGLGGYEFKVTGGSDHCGFPMRWDVNGPNRKKIFAVSGVGLRKTRKGKRVRKTVCGNTIGDKTAQVNVTVTKAGSAPLVPPKEEAAAEEKKE